MKVIYIADDGKQFDGAFECLDYEWRAAHSYLEDIHVYDEWGKRLEDLFSEDNYCRADVVIVDSLKGAMDLYDLAKYCGFCGYEDINSAGKWVWDYEKSKFVKEN